MDKVLMGIAGIILSGLGVFSILCGIGLFLEL